MGRRQFALQYESVASGFTVTRRPHRRQVWVISAIIFGVAQLLFAIPVVPGANPATPRHAPAPQ
jgi:hypothetical protein